MPWSAGRGEGATGSGPSTANKLTIKDCRTGGAINEEDQIEGILIARMNGGTYPCNPASA